MENYKKYLGIDKNDLDEECVKQPTLYDKFASQVPDLIHSMDIAKTEMEKLYATMYQDIVSTSIGNGEKKPTDKAIDNEITSSELFQEEKLGYYEAKKKAELGKVIKESFMQRKEMIRGLIELHNSTYWSRSEKKTDLDARGSRDNRNLRRRKGG